MRSVITEFRPPIQGKGCGASTAPQRTARILLDLNDGLFDVELEPEGGRLRYTTYLKALCVAQAHMRVSETAP